MQTITTTAVRIKVEFGYYPGTYNAPQDGYLMGEPQYDHGTGRETYEPLTFASVKEAYDYLTSEHDGYTHGTGCEYGHDGIFAMGGTYYTSHGQYTRPTYTIVSAKSGRCTKAIIAACESINDQSATPEK